MTKLGRLVRVRAVEPRDEFTVYVEFEDGTHRLVNLDVYLHGPIFEPIRNDPALFRSVKIQDGTLTWDNGADIDPDVLYYNLAPAWMEMERALA